jgi:hypothetical protein
MATVRTCEMEETLKGVSEQLVADLWQNKELYYDILGENKE